MGNTKFFDPMNITVVDGQRRVHTRMLHIGEDNVYAGDFEQAVVEDLQGRRYITVVDAGENQIVADGVRLDVTKPVERAFKEKLSIKTPKFTFEAASGIIRITDRSVTVTLQDRASIR